MTQNIYDNPGFFEQYSALERSVHGLAGAPEWPSLRSMLPDMRDTRVLDLGCGFGWFCRWAREQGAASVLGLDVSQNMLQRAREMTVDDSVTYLRTDLSVIQLPEETYDLVFSSLALHYLESVDELFRRAFRALLPGGSFVFSTEHPIYTAPSCRHWLTQNDGRSAWPVNQYLVEGSRESDWLSASVVKYHRTIATTVNLLIRSGFELTHLNEWGPSEEQLSVHPDWSEHRDRPMFLLVSATKRRTYSMEAQL